MSFGRLTTAQIESGPLRKTQRTTARSPQRSMLHRSPNVWIDANMLFTALATKSLLWERLRARVAVAAFAPMSRLCI